jgi:hypothetical protein
MKRMDFKHEIDEQSQLEELIQKKLDSKGRPRRALAMKAMCTECMNIKPGGKGSKNSDCLIPSCPLYAYQPWRNKRGKVSPNPDISWVKDFVRVLSPEHLEALTEAGQKALREKREDNNEG